MRILFICGSIEPGCDGVGDYTRMLAAELIRRGNEAAIIGLNDKYITSPLEQIQKAKEISIQVRRLPSAPSSSESENKLREWIKNFTPDWVSLQYVPYAYDSQGLPFKFGKTLLKISCAAKWHLMVHEPYIGDPKNLKNTIVGFFQRRILQILVKDLKPYIIHTTIPSYQKLLTNISIPSKILGLFGNIEIEGNGRVLDNIDLLKTVYFGSAPKADVHQLLAEKINKFCTSEKKKIQIIFCGKWGPNGEAFAETIRANCQEENCEIIIKGALPPEDLSKIFNSSHIGMARVPSRALGKSGSILAMLEHGLPVWVPLEDGGNFDEELDFRSELCFKNLSDAKKLKKRTQYSRLPEIAKGLESDLIQAKGSVA